MEKIQVEKTNGCTLRFDHFRFRKGDESGKFLRYHRGRSSWKPTERGGATFCFVYDENGEICAHGLAECSVKDAFCYRLGREIARGRALKMLAGQ